MSNNSANEAGTGSTIQLDNMSLDQLQQIQQQEENRLQALVERYSQLSHASARIDASHRAVEELKLAPSDQPVLVPLTESLYVPAKVQDPHKLLVELGTGYYVEKSSKETSQYLERKATLVNANSHNITQAIQASRQNLQAITMTIQGKLLEIRARQEGSRYKQQQEEG